MKYVAVYMAFVLVVFLLFDIMQGILNIKHPPYIEYPYKGAKYAVVYIFQISRTGKNSYSEYKYKCIHNKWRYIINRDNIFATLFVYIILLAGVVLAVPKELFSAAFIANVLFVVTIIAFATGFYFPIKGYVILVKSLRETSD